MAAKDPYILVAAIDFGTTFSGYAFSFIATKDEPDAPENIKMNRNWGESVGFQSHKTPTSVLTTRAGEFIAFGYEAEHQYGEALEEGEGAAADMMLFKNFKMMLHKREEVKRKACVVSVDNTAFPAIDIFAHAIGYLKDHLLETLRKESGRKIDASLIRWVLTVPAIWSDESKQFMREAAYKAGLASSKNSETLVIALEPEAASMCCRRLNIARYSSDVDVSFPAGTKYIVVDCGGGTVDITAHAIESENAVKELKVASGGDLGATQVDKNFLEFLASLFGVNFMNKYQAKYPEEWLRLVNDFDRVKRSFKPDGKSKLKVEIKYEMGKLYKKLNDGKEIEQTIEEATDKGVGFVSGSLTIKHHIAMTFFDPVIQGIVQHVRDLLQDDKVKPLDFIFMVGGFSDCLVLQKAIEENFGGNGLRILIPSGAQLAILKGAVLYGHNQSEIKQRIARYTYGCRMKHFFNPKIHDPQYKFTDGDGNERCRNVFSIYVEKGEEITVGEKREFNTYTLAGCGDEVLKSLYALDAAPAKPVQYVTDPRVRAVGTITLKTPKEAQKKSREIITRVEFGGTELRIEAEFVATGDKTVTTLNFLHD